MSRIAYVNGAYVQHAEAGVHIEDRGYQFADGVYEVCEVRHGLIVDLTRHLDRLDRSLRELRMDWPMARAALIVVIRQVLRRNRVKNGMFYLQVTRGVRKPRPCVSCGRNTVHDRRHRQEHRCRRHCGQEQQGHQGDHRSGQPLGSGRYQDRRPAAQCHGPPEGEGGRARRRRSMSMPTGR